MTRNRCLNYLKHKNIIDKYAISIQAAVPSGEERLYNFDFNFDEGDTPYLHQDLEKQIKQLLDLLPDRCREVFILSRFNGLKNREIAEELHVSLHAVERHIQRALRIFSEALSHEKSGCLRSLLLACLIQLTS